MLPPILTLTLSLRLALIFLSASNQLHLITLGLFSQICTTVIIFLFFLLLLRIPDLLVAPVGNLNEQIETYTLILPPFVGTLLHSLVMRWCTSFRP